MDDDRYASVRDPGILGRMIGATVVDITQHDQDEFEEDGESFVAFHFSNGYTVTFPFDADADLVFTIEPNPDDDPHG